MNLIKIETKDIVKLTDLEIEGIYKSLKNDFDNHLKEKGVSLPILKKNNKYYKQALMLVLLKKFEGKLLHKNQISEFVSFYLPDIKDAQVRHLGTQKGWYILNKNEEYNEQIVSSGFHLLVDTKKVKPNFIKEKRQVLINSNSWEELKEKYQYKCATCGCKEHSIHRYKGQKVLLQKGHLDPSKPLELGNIIPQCQHCNQQYKDKFIFNEFGEVKKINSPEIVLSSPEETQKKILELLLKKFS